MSSIDWDAALIIAALVVVLAFSAAWLYEYFNNGGGPPQSGWGVYADEEQVKKLNEIQRKRNKSCQA